MLAFKYGLKFTVMLYYVNFRNNIVLCTSAKYNIVHNSTDIWNHAFKYTVIEVTQTQNKNWLNKHAFKKEK